jgi:hypothetical protein
MPTVVKNKKAKKIRVPSTELLDRLTPKAKRVAKTLFTDSVAESLDSVDFAYRRGLLIKEIFDEEGTRSLSHLLDYLQSVGLVSRTRGYELIRLVGNWELDEIKGSVERAAAKGFPRLTMTHFIVLSTAIPRARAELLQDVVDGRWSMRRLASEISKRGLLLNPPRSSNSGSRARIPDDPRVALDKCGKTVNAAIRHTEELLLQFKHQPVDPEESVDGLKSIVEHAERFIELVRSFSETGAVAIKELECQVLAGRSALTSRRAGQPL